MKRTYDVKDLPDNEQEAFELIFSHPKGIKIKNPYADDFFEMQRMTYGLKILNELIKNKSDAVNSHLKRFKIPKLHKGMVKELKKRMKEWKI